LIAFIKECEKGCSLPFSILGCLNANGDTEIEEGQFVIDFKMNDATAIGTSKAL
jgi:hypothetical protein